MTNEGSDDNAMLLSSGNEETKNRSPRFGVVAMAMAAI